MVLVPYREIIGMLNHLVVHTRPEMAYHLSSLARFVTAPGPRHWLAAKHLLRYLKGSASMGLLYKPGPTGDLVVTGRMPVLPPVWILVALSLRSFSHADRALSPGNLNF
jgi:hypothetical protein